MQFDENDFLETATPDILQRIAKARELTRRYYMTDYADGETRRQILTELFGRIGKNVNIDAPFHCDHGDNILIGDNVIIGMNCIFVDNRPITIGNNVLIASGVQIYTATHPVEAEERLIEPDRENGVFFRTLAKPVVIEDGAWIGGGAIILPGVTVGKNSVIGAGSVVTRSVPANSVAAGNPCKVLRSTGRQVKP